MIITSYNIDVYYQKIIRKILGKMLHERTYVLKIYKEKS